jgi:hypothetical protein
MPINGEIITEYGEDEAESYQTLIEVKYLIKDTIDYDGENVMIAMENDTRAKARARGWDVEPTLAAMEALPSEDIRFRVLINARSPLDYQSQRSPDEAVDEAFYLVRIQPTRRHTVRSTAG